MPKIKSRVWNLDAQDCSVFLEHGQRVELNVIPSKEKCPKCGGRRVRRRIIENRMAGVKTKILYCPDCDHSYRIEEVI